MIDSSSTRYDLVALPPVGRRVHLGPLLRGLQWEEQPGELAVRLQAQLHNEHTPAGRVHALLPNGAPLLLLADWGPGWQEVWRGTVRRWGPLTDGGRDFSLTAYDQLFHLAKSKDDRYYPAGATGRHIITDIADAWSIPLGTIDGPDVAVAKSLFRSKTLAAMILDVLEQTKKRGGGRWIVRSAEGRVHVLRAGQNSPCYWLKADESVQEVEHEQSIEDLVTRVKIVGSAGDEQAAPVVAVLDGRTEFGVLQELVASSASDSPDSARQEAQDLLDERGKPIERRKVVGPDLPFLRRGDRVRVDAATLAGYYLVAGVQHNADARTMILEVDDEG